MRALNLFITNLVAGSDSLGKHASRAMKGAPCLLKSNKVMGLPLGTGNTIAFLMSGGSGGAFVSVDLSFATDDVYFSFTLPSKTFSRPLYFPCKRLSTLRSLSGACFERMLRISFSTCFRDGVEVRP